MRKILAVLSLFCSAIAHSADYSVEIGTAATTGGSGAVTPAIPGDGSAGKLLILVAASNVANSAITDNPTDEGFTYIDDSDAAAVNGAHVWAKISTGSDTDPTVSFANTSKGAYVIAVTSTTGWPAIGTAVATYTQSGDQGFQSQAYYMSHTQETSGNFGLQVAFGNKNTTGETLTSTDVTSGFAAAGFAARSNSAGGFFISSQWQKMAGNISQNSETVNTKSGNFGKSAGITIEFEPITGSTTTWTDDTVDVGTTIQGTLDVAFSGAITKCVFASGDELTASNADTDSADCAQTKADFLSGGSLSNTRIASATTASLDNASETSTADAFTFNSPDNGLSEHFGTAACANPGCDDDSLYENSDFTTEYAAFASGDDVWVTVSTGACDFEATTGVFSCTTLPATGVVRVYDVTATDWLTESSWNIEAPVTAGSYKLRIASPLRDAIRSPLRAPIQ